MTLVGHVERVQTKRIVGQQYHRYTKYKREKREQKESGVLEAEARTKAVTVSKNR